MILGKQYGIHSVDRLLGRLEKARVAVVRISHAAASESTPSCTAFFITRDLIVAPAFAIQNAKAVDVECFRNGKRIWRQTISSRAEFLDATPDVPERWRSPILAILRIASKPGRPSLHGFGEDDEDGVLEIGFDAPESGQFVAVVQFPRGNNIQGVSFGTLRAAEGAMLRYDADTDHGSSGAPVLDANWRVIGVHFGSDAPTNTNFALSRAALVDVLRQSRSWKKIRDRHRIADVGAAKEQIAIEAAPAESEKPDPELVRAALMSSVEPKPILRPYVVDPSAKQWSLRSSERARILRAAGSLEELRKIRKPYGSAKDTTQSVIDRILAGPPYDLFEFDEDSLVAWIQASRWFAGVHRAIPTPAQVTRVLERKRVRSRLDAIAGADFRGRRTELEQLNRWWKKSDRPLSVTGIGGIGKSALIARFAAQLPQRTLLLWLDFDRADLAPDDRASVLSAIAHQAAVQLDRFQPPEISIEQWESYATNLGERLVQALPRNAAALLVLDSFEAAQYRAKYQELWDVLELLAKTLPRLRLIVTGRASVPELRLGDHPAEHIFLRGLEKIDARNWLRKHGVSDPDLLSRVLELADGVPLILRLAQQLIERGGGIADFERVPPEIVVGYLYGRILDRVENQEYKPIARAALVLRRLSREMIDPVLRDVVALPEGEISEWFPKFSREIALVEGTDVLRLRPEVRTAALKLVERDDPDLVRRVDERAAAWFAAQTSSDVEIAAELVYHRLRLDDPDGAEAAWRDGCGRFLVGAAEELPPKSKAAKKWLQVRLGVAEAESPELQQAGDLDAAERIRSARSRGHQRAVEGILREREDAASAGPLVFQAAYELWTAGNAADATALLENAMMSAAPVSGAVWRDRRVLSAMLSAQSGDVLKADEALLRLDGELYWSDCSSPSLYALAVRAARFRLTVDLETECALIAGPDVDALSSLDVFLPRLIDRLPTDDMPLEAAFGAIEIDVSDPVDVGTMIHDIRDETPDLRKERRRMEQAWTRSGPWAAAAGLPEKNRLMEMSRRRWWLASSTSFLTDAYRIAAEGEQTALGASIIGTLALFAFPRIVRSRVVELVGPRGTFTDVLAQSTPRQILRVDEAQWPRVERMLREGVDDEHDWSSDVREDVSSLTGKKMMTFRGDLMSFPPHHRAAIIHLMSPDPLQQLVHELAGYSGAETP